MKKKFLTVILALPILMLVACNNQTGVGSSSSSSENSVSSQTPITSSSTNKELPSLQQVMRNIAELKNYTYTMNDEIFDMTTNIYYTEKAYYVDYINPSNDSAVPFGYAEDNSNQVFEFIIEDNQVVPGDFYRNQQGSVISGLWDNAIISFADFNIDAFSNQVSEDNTYKITDDANKLLFAVLAGYGDVYVLPYIEVSVEVTSETSFISTVTFTPDNPNYTGSCVGELHSIGETEIPYIDEYIENGGSAKVDLSENLISVLQTLKNDNNYTLEVTNSSNSNHYIDTVTSDYYYSDNKLTPSLSKGYLNLANSAYNFTLEGNQVVIGSEITYSSSTSHSFWDNVSSIHNFKNINLSNLSLEEVEGGLKLSNNVSVLTSLYDLVHTVNYFPVVNAETDYALFTSISDTKLEFDLHIESEATFHVVITNINTTKNDVIESYIEENKDFDSSDISKLIETFTSIKDSKNYKIVLENKFSTFAPNLNEIGNIEINVSETNYLVKNLSDETKSYGYKMNEGKLTRYTLVEGEEVLGDTYDGDMLENDVFTSLNNLDTSSFKADATLQDEYIVTDSTTIEFIANLLTFPSSDFMTYISKLTLEVVSESSISIIGTTSFYGSFSAVISAAE